MLTDDWDSLSIDTMRQAIENGYSEGKQLEFKREQDPDTPGHRNSTVAEIVSFANSGGGDLVIGMLENEGVADALYPVEYDDVDDLILRWSDIIQRNTDPELPQHLLDIEPIEVTEDHEEFVSSEATTSFGHVLVLRTQRSWRAPHRETSNYQFYERSPAGKSRLDAGGIRRAMLQGDMLVERAKEFRDDRLSAIRSDEIAVPLRDLPKVVLHIVPSNAFDVGGVLDPSAANHRNQSSGSPSPSLLNPRVNDGQWSRFTEDGFLAGTRYEQYENRFANYTLTFRSGVIETLTTRSWNETNGSGYILSGHVRNCLETALPTYADFLDQQGAAFPLYCFMSVLDAQGLPVATQRTSMRESDDLNVIHQSTARLPAARIMTPNEDLDPIVDSLMDFLYNASGQAGEMRTE